MAGNEWTFTVKPWAGGSTHDIDTYKRRAKAYITGAGLSRPADISDVEVVDVVVSVDGTDTAEVTYRLVT